MSIAKYRNGTKASVGDIVVGHSMTDGLPFSGIVVSIDNTPTVAKLSIAPVRPEEIKHVDDYQCVRLVDAMKATALLLLLCLFGVGCAFQGVPSNKIKISGPSGTYVIQTPKNVEIEQFTADVETWGTLRLKFEKWKSTNDPQAINSAGAADVARGRVIIEGMQAAFEAALKAAAKP